ncbi:hypothetical protein ANPL_00495 [Anaplasma platys]|uniref:DUF2628 domain-containing protein n=1 Tax=Anaplasma platys TaxID=949 RepID=A0A858PXB6_9RICK|nr:DUF2628 domain-containing protein [Anaplasma platys]QJC27220.1 hypothetical protein ANPL_00495 [Anaplasma platys]
MNFFHVYTHASGKTVYVRDGFTMGAFLFTFFYSMCKGLWLMSALLFMASTATYMLHSSGVISLQFYLLAELTIKLYAGFSFNDWMKSRLERKSYGLADVLLANSVLHAKLRFMERNKKPDEIQVGDAPAEAHTTSTI